MGDREKYVREQDWRERGNGMMGREETTQEGERKQHERDKGNPL